MKEQVLLVNDLCGYGKVALAAMMPMLSHMGYRVCTLPTALVSNTLDYGTFDILDTTQFMRNSLAIWDDMGFSFDAVATGLIASNEQAELVAAYCEGLAARKVPVFVDPIMGDEGHLYNGVGEDAVVSMRRLVSCATVTCPNYTEACLLTGVPYRAEGVDDAEARQIVDALRAMGAKSVVVTSVVYEGHNAVIGWDHTLREHFDISYTPIPVHFPGTGDIFASILLARTLEGLTLEGATADAMRVVETMVERGRRQHDTYKGLPIESMLGIIDEA